MDYELRPEISLGAEVALNSSGEVSAPAYQKAMPPLRFDSNLYLEYVRQEGLSDEEACATLDAIWKIIISFVDMGFRLDPVQQVQDLRADHVNGNQTMLAGDSAPVVSCREAFNKAARAKPASRKRRAARRKDS